MRGFLWYKLLTNLVLATIMSLSCSCNASAARQSDISVLRAYEDSLRNDDTLLNEEQVSRLTTWLAKLDSAANFVMPADEARSAMKSYCGQALGAFAWHLIQSGQWYLSEPVIDMGMRYCGAERDSLFYSLQSAQVSIALELKDYGRAERLIKEAKVYFEHERDTVGCLKAYLNLARVYVVSGDQNQAETCYKQVLDITEKPNFRMYRAIAVSYMEKLGNDSTMSLSLLEESADISRRYRLTALYAGDAMAIAKYLARQGDYNRALSNADKAIGYARRYGQLQTEGQAYALKGAVYARQRDYGLAYSMLLNQGDLNSRLHSGEAIRDYRSMNTAIALMRWCHDNVPLDTGTAGAKTDENKPNVSVWIIVALGVVIMVIAYVMRRKRISYESRESSGGRMGDESETEQLKQQLRETLEKLQQIQEQERDAETTRQADMVMLEGANDVMDRIRGMLRAIPRSGVSDTDTGLRNLSAYMLQNRLPIAESSARDKRHALYEAFMSKLDSLGCNLTLADKRLAYYLRLGLTSKQITVLTGMQSKSLTQARWRLRKALGLEQNANLEAYLAAIALGDS